MSSWVDRFCPRAHKTLVGDLWTGTTVERVSWTVESACSDLQAGDEGMLSMQLTTESQVLKCGSGVVHKDDKFQTDPSPVAVIC